MSRWIPCKRNDFIKRLRKITGLATLCVGGAMMVERS